MWGAGAGIEGDGGGECFSLSCEINMGSRFIQIKVPTFFGKIAAVVPSLFNFCKLLPLCLICANVQKYAANVQIDGNC